MENTYRILPWKIARRKGFRSVRAPKSRSVSSLDDLSHDQPRTRSGSTTSLPAFSMDDTEGSEKEYGIKQSTSSQDIHHNGIDLESPDSVGNISFLSNQSRDSFVSNKSESEIIVDKLVNGNKGSEKEYGINQSTSSQDIRHNGIDLQSPDSVGNMSFVSDQSEGSFVSNKNESENNADRLVNGSTQDRIDSKKTESVKNSTIRNEMNRDSQMPIDFDLPTSAREEQLRTSHNEYSSRTHTNRNSSGNNVIILNNVGVENANEYDKLHPHEYNQLALLLQELDSLIKALPSERQIGTPFSSSNFVAAQLDHRGGRIRLSEPDVCLCVPPGAIPQGKPQILYMYIVNPRIPALSDFGDEDHWLTPIVHCGPPGMQFESYVALSLPSSVADESAWNLTVSRGVQPEYTDWESLESRDDNVVFIKRGRITVLVDHFTPYGAKGKPNSEECTSRWMEAGVFVHPPCGEGSEEEVQFHVRVWNVADRKRVLHEERKLLRTCLAEPIRAIRIHDSGKPIQVQVEEVRPLWVLWNNTGKVIPFQNLWRGQHGGDCPDCPSITFIAQASEAHLSDWHRGSFRATVRLFQQGHDSEGISFLVRGNPEKMATLVFKDGQLRDENGTTYLRQQPSMDPLYLSTPPAMFPLSEEHFHEVCLQLDGTPTDIGEKSWRAFSRTANLGRKEVDAIKACAQQHQHKSPSDLLLTYFIGDPCRRFDTLRTLQEIWYILYHIGNDGGREEVEEEMYQKMTLVRGKPKERLPSDVSSVMECEGELSPLVMTSDEQMSDLDENNAKVLESTLVADEETLTESTGGNEVSDASTLDLKDVVGNGSNHRVKDPMTQTGLFADKDVAASESSQIHDSCTDISDDLEMQLTEFSKHWAVSEDSLGSDSDLCPSSEAELLKILMADDGQSQFTQNGGLSFDDPQREALPLNFQPITTSENTVQMARQSPNREDVSSDDAEIVIYRDTGVIVDRKPRPVRVDKQNAFDEPDEMKGSSQLPTNVGDSRSVNMSPEMNDTSIESTSSMSTTHHDASAESVSDIELDECSPLFSPHTTVQKNTRQDDIVPMKNGAFKSVSESLDKEGDSGQGSLPDESEESAAAIPVKLSKERKQQPANTEQVESNGPKRTSDSHVNGKMNPPKSPGSGKSIRIQYQTLDIENDESRQNANSNQNNGNIHSTKPSSSWPLSKGPPSYVSKNGSKSVPDIGKRVRSQPRSPKSPKREDRDCLRQIARFALTGKSEENITDEMQSGSTSPGGSSQSSIFDFSLLQPVRGKGEEFV